MRITLQDLGEMGGQLRWGSILKDTEMGSVYSVWERSDLSVCSVVEKEGE